MLTSDIAEQIVIETMSRLNRNINIMDFDGRIIASGDRKRIGDRHIGAVEAIRSGETIVIEEANKDSWSGTLQGINMPIRFQHRIVGAIGITGSPEEVSEFAELVRMATELMLQQAFLSSRQEWRNRLKEAIFEEWGKKQPDLDKIHGQLAMLQFHPRAPIRVYFIRLERSIGYHSRLLHAIEELWGDKEAFVGLVNEYTVGMIVFGMEEKRTEVVFERVKKGLRQETASAFRIGCSGVSSGTEEIPALLREAQFALSLAGSPGETVYYEGLEPLMIAYQSEESTRTRFLARIFEGVSDTLRQTLQVFFDCNQSLQNTAEALFLHKNTIIYRLKKIKETTGYDPQQFRDAVALQLALWLTRIPRENETTYTMR